MNFLRTLLYAAILSFAVVSCETMTTPEPTDSAASTPPKPYPLDTCLVTGEGLESKGGSVTQIYEGQEVKLCCKACQFAFKSNPEQYLAKLP